MQARSLLLLPALMAALALAACDGGQAGNDVQVRQTKFPGQVSAGGGTSGEVLARSSQVQNNPMPAGTPGIPQGSGGNPGGAALGGTVQGSSELGGSGDKTAAQQPAQLPNPGNPPAQQAPTQAAPSVMTK